MATHPVPQVRLHGHPGLLRFVAPTEAEPAGDAEPRWVWEGAVDGPGLAALVRSALLLGVVPCDLEGRPHRARALGCWYDAGRGTLVVELAGRPEPLA